MSPAATPICQHCGYLMTGLPVPGLCPECGKPVDGRPVTRRAEPLPAWLYGATIVWAGAAVVVLLKVKDVASAKSASEAFDRLATVLVAASILLAAGAITLSVLAARRRRLDYAASVIAGLLAYGALLALVRWS